MPLFTRPGLSVPVFACCLLALAGSAASARQLNPQVNQQANQPAAEQSPLRPAVRWSNGLTERLAPMSSAQVSSAVTALAVRPEARRVQVTLDRPPTAADRQSLRASGLTLLSPLGGTTYFAALTPGANARSIAGAGVVSVGPIDATRKMHADVAGGVVRSWTLVGPAEEKLRSRLDAGLITIEELAKLEADPLVATIVMFHRDADGPAEAARLAAKMDGEVRSQIRSVNAAVLHLRASRVALLADDDAVMWVEPPLPALTELNAQNRALTGVDTVNAAPYGLDGSGVTVMVYDGGRVATHPDLAGRLTLGDSSSIADHATHVAGTVGGSGAGNAANRGMAPGVRIVSYGFEQPGGGGQGFLYTDPGDLEADYTGAINQHGADISNNSIGTNTEPNGFPCEWQGNYGVTSALIDAIAAGSIGDPFRIVWAAGNERQGSRCDVEGFGDYYSSAPPAGAKNHIAVGSVDSDTDLTSSFSSWGPFDDGRIKPDVSAPGCQAGGDGGVTSLSSSGGYSVKCGTSMASPTVAGISALVLEQWRLSFSGEPDMRPATLKAVLANSAEDRGNPGPDYQYGFGSVRAVAAVDTVLAENVIEAEIGQGEVYRFVVVIGPEDQELKVTVAWDDAPGTPNVNPVLVNDLDVRVIGPDGTTSMPWTLNPANPGAPAVRTVRDGINNIEQVFIENPVPGGYTVEVTGFNIAEGPTQTFSAASNAFLVNCSSAGIVGFGAGVIPCEGGVGVQVIDCDLNISDAAVDTVDVLITSDSQPGGLVLTLTETAPESAAFLASFPFSASGAGGLAVSPGDEVTVTYIDADDGTGASAVRTRTILVDCQPPAVLSATATGIGPRAATIEIETDEPTGVEVRYGLAMDALDGVASSSGPRTAHAIDIAGLQDDTDYVFVVSQITDAAGNTASDDNGGVGFAFTTPDIPDLFTEQFTSGVDLDNRRVEFRPAGGFEFYTACSETLLGGLPVDPAGGTVLTLSDDSNREVVLTGGARVSVYGESYDRFFIGSNGYVTFGSGDSAHSETLSAHFGRVRVAALFDDLNPSTRGTVSWKQLSDRAVVTWDGVAEYNTQNSNTFQIELFFDGRIAINYGQIAVGDAIVGLSNGAGLSPDFFPSDLSGYGSCGPRPPVAANLAVNTEVNTPVMIELPATDDGGPDPLVYSVLSLPSRGSLVDLQTGLAVSSVPYTIPGGSSLLEYIPDYNTQGADSLSFLADDGGDAPSGGLSNTGVVTITVGGPQPVHEFLVDDTNPGWAMTGQWAFGAPAGAGGDPSSGLTGSNVLGYNLAGQYPNNMAREYLTTGALDFTGVTGVTLEFWRWLGVESATFDKASVEVAVNDGPWQVVWSHTGGSLSETAWSQQSIDLSSIADEQSAVRVRWVMGTTDGSVTYAGWNLDDIVFLGVTAIAPCPADLAEPDGVLNFFDVTTFLAYFNNQDARADFAAPFGTFNFFDVTAFLAAYNAGCP